VSFILFGVTQHEIINPTTLTGAILTLLEYKPALQLYINPISIAINICTADPVLTLAITGFQNWMPPSIPSLNTGTRTRRMLTFLILLLFITPVEAIPSLQDTEILSKAATLLSTFWLRNRAHAEDEPGEYPLPPLDNPTILGTSTLPTSGHGEPKGFL
jgi:hypothetical protein